MRVPNLKKLEWFKTTTARVWKGPYSIYRKIGKEAGTNLPDLISMTLFYAGLDRDLISTILVEEFGIDKREAKIFATRLANELMSSFQQLSTPIVEGSASKKKPQRFSMTRKMYTRNNG